MFDNEYQFTGRHARIVKELTSVFGYDNVKIFERNVDVLIMAPIVGFIYGCKGIQESSKSDENVVKINYQQLQSNLEDLRFNYQLIMLLDKKNEPSYEERINKAFRYLGDKLSKEDWNLFNEYILGGIEKLQEKLLEESVNPEDYVLNLYELVNEIQERYNEDSDLDGVEELFKLAKA